MKTLTATIKISRLCTHTHLHPQLNLQSLFPIQPYLPVGAIRHASGLSLTKGKKPESNKKSKKKKNASVGWREPDVSLAEQFSLLDAMRYIRAFEVGRPPKSIKYDLAIKMRSVRNGPTIRNRIRLPHPIKTDLRIAVICPPNSPAATAALEAGASLVGEDDLLARIKGGDIPFDRLLCHGDSAQKLNKAGLGRVLGPKGLMPSAKTGTMVRDVKKAIGEMVGSNEYREKQGVVRMAVAQLGFSPGQVQENVRMFMESVKSDMVVLSERITKEIHEVVLSSTNSPGFSLNGDFKSPTSLPVADLSVL